MHMYKKTKSYMAEDEHEPPFEIFQVYWPDLVHNVCRAKPEKVNKRMEWFQKPECLIFAPSIVEYVKIVYKCLWLHKLDTVTRFDWC